MNVVITTRTCVRVFVSAALMMPATPAFSSSPDAWVAHQKEVVKKCIQASGLNGAKLAGELLEYDDRVGFTVAMIVGVYPQPHMNLQKGRSLCLFDKRTRKAHSVPADKMK